MSDASFFDSLLHRRVRAASGRLFWVGLVLVVLGLAAVLFPIISTLVAALLVGWVLFVFGCVSLVSSFSMHGAGPFFAALLLSLLSIAAGAFLLFNPLAGAVALTLMVGVIFSLQGAFEITFAFEVRPHAGWVGWLVSGIASIVMAVLIAAGWPGISVFLLGFLLGVNFVTTGVAYMMFARALTRLA